MSGLLLFPESNGTESALFPYPDTHSRPIHFIFIQMIAMPLSGLPNPNSTPIHKKRLGSDPGINSNTFPLPSLQIV